jgi:redox-sensitive bicupin YhaK (pirin superfamily)
MDINVTATDDNFEAYPSRETELGSLQIARALPLKQKRSVGPWCFLDRYGPLTFVQKKPMDVAPHPHMGLQTVSWLIEGEVLHNDSLGYDALVRPGGVIVMTSGSGISHSEETPGPNTGRLNGVQMWVALPDSHRRVSPALQHIESVPVAELRGGLVKVFAGSFAGVVSPAIHHSEIVGADVQIHAGELVQTPLNAKYEHAAFVLDGDCNVNGRRLEPRVLYYISSGRSEILFGSLTGGRLLFVGGPAFVEPIVMWWNFVARTAEEIAEAKADWDQHSPRFGEVKAYNGARLAAPPLNRLARPNPMS